MSLDIKAFELRNLEIKNLAAQYSEMGAKLAKLKDKYDYLKLYVEPLVDEVNSKLKINTPYSIKIFDFKDLWVNRGDKTIFYFGFHLYENKVSYLDEEFKFKTVDELIGYILKSMELPKNEKK